MESAEFCRKVLTITVRYKINISDFSFLYVADIGLKKILSTIKYSYGYSSDQHEIHNLHASV